MNPHTNFSLFGEIKYLLIDFIAIHQEINIVYLNFDFRIRQNIDLEILICTKRYELFGLGCFQH